MVLTRREHGPTAGRGWAHGGDPGLDQDHTPAASRRPRSPTLAPDQGRLGYLPRPVTPTSRPPRATESTCACSGFATWATPANGVSRSTAPATTTTIKHSCPAAGMPEHQRTPSTPPAGSNSATPPPGPDPDELQATPHADLSHTRRRTRSSWRHKVQARVDQQRAACRELATFADKVQ